MVKHGAIRLFVAINTAITLFFISNLATAFNPQPEPPADLWRIEGFINLTALEIATTGSDIPFGVDEGLVADDIIDFRIAIVATFKAPDSSGDGKPDDGVYSPVIEYFRVQIGNTRWDETMPSEELALQVQHGLVTGVRAVVTATRPTHPDLALKFPASPGTWEATDDRDGVDLGTISGSYSLLDAEVSDKPQISVTDGFIKLDAVQESVPAESDCTLQEHYGRMLFDASNALLYICSQSGWISK